MKKFSERSLEERLKVVTEDCDSMKTLPWNEGIKIKLLVLFPSLVFILMTIIKHKEGIKSVATMITWSLICISFGVFLYSRRIR